MKCWYCGRLTMEEEAGLGKDWYKCFECGATHLEHPATFKDVETIVIEENSVDGQLKYRPSYWVTERARKAREG